MGLKEDLVTESALSLGTLSLGLPTPLPTKEKRKLFSVQGLPGSSELLISS